MQRAADAVATEAIGLLDGRQRGASILLLVGPGNNGSDTVYAGARLSANGHRVDAVVFGTQRKEPRSLSPVGEGGEGLRVLDPVKALEQVKGIRPHH